MKTRSTRFLSMLLAVLMIFSLLPMGAFAAETGSDTVTVIACSDFQNPTSDSQGQAVIRNIMSRIQQDHPTADGFLCCGDYSYGYSGSASALQAHITALDNVVIEKYSGIDAANRVYIQGNHDQVKVGTGGLANSGNNDPSGSAAGKYGVFVINEDDYMWGSNASNSSTTYSGKSAQQIVQQTANNLDSYLSEKQDAGFTAPIFVLSHLPLHYSMRTSRDGDGTYANLIFDVLNRYGDDLNIIFLYGHDHSHAWDDYLGGAAVYLAKGDTINIAQGSKTNFAEETLKFTYMNAGFTGYYEQKSTTAEDTLTMTAFEISGNKVEVNRYSADGVYNLKSAGVWNGEYNDSGLGYSRDTRVIPSPAEIILTSDTPTPTDPVGFNQTVNGITVTADGGSALTVSDCTLNAQQLQLLGEVNSYVAYDINVTDLVGTATVKMPVPAGYASGTVKVYHYVDDAFVDMNATIQDGYAVFTTDSFSPFVLASVGAAPSVPNTVTKTGTLPGTVEYQLVTNGKDGIVSGEKYLIVSGNSGTAYAMNSNVGSVSVSITADKKITNLADNTCVFTLTGSNGSYSIKDSNGTYLYPNYNNGRQIVKGSSSGQNVTFNGTNYVTIYRSNSSRTTYLRYSNNAFGASSSSSNLYLFKQVSSAPVNVELRFNGVNIQNGSTAEQLKALLLSAANISLKVNGEAVDVTADMLNVSSVTLGIDGNYYAALTYTTTDGRSVSFSGTDGIPVTVYSAVAVRCADDQLNGTVEAGAAGNATTGTTIIAEMPNGSEKNIDVTVGMLNGNFNIDVPGTYTGLTVKYADMVATDNYTLVVTPHTDWTQFQSTATSYKYTLDKDGINTNKGYLIVASGTNRALIMNGTSLTTKAVTINGDDILVDSQNYEWTFGNSTSNPTIRYKSNSRYLYSDSGTLATKTGTTNITWTASHRGGSQSGQYVINQTRQDTFLVIFTDTYYNYLYHNGSAFAVTDTRNESTSNTVRLYYANGTVTPPSTWIGMSSVPVYVTRGISADDLAGKVTAAVDIWKYTGANPSTAEATALDPSACTFDYSGVSRNADGTYYVPVKYNGTQIGSVKVVVAGVDHIIANGMVGTVEAGSSTSAKTGTTITAVTPDGTESIINVTVGMLTGSFNINTPGTYSNLTINYDGKTVNGYTLIVTAKNPYPAFPDEGSVRVGKSASSEDFQNTGVAKVELTATGVPIKKGIDVIVMLDTSSSMNSSSVDGKTRLNIMKDSLKEMVQTLNKPNSDGSDPDIRMAIADFNGYTYASHSDSLTGGQDRDNTNNAKIYTGTYANQKVTTSGVKLDAGAFESISAIANKITSINNNISYASGTNYDYAFDAIYNLGAAIKAQNEAQGKDRDLVVVFMSDGAPFQYNYFEEYSSVTEWNNWLKGTYNSTSEIPTNSSHKDFYNGPGNKLRMAEAVKGNPGQNYQVIKKTTNPNSYNSGTASLTTVPGLGATVYSIGFCLEVDSQITVDSMQYVLRGISSDPAKYYYEANNAAQLDDAFTKIAGAIKYAATNARFVDTMGADYDLRMTNYGGGNSNIDVREPVIQVINYETYKANQVGTVINGELVTADMVGKRTGTASIIETVSFAENGGNIIAASNKNPGVNILENGVICANNFWYNTTQNPVDIDTNGDGTADYSLAPETFYWKMGTINESELALSYYVYLTGSMEGTRPAGSYPTNEDATLYYTNYLDDPNCYKETVPPRMPWKAAHVSYAFYLVDQNGNVITNTATGATGSFADKIAITNPIVFGEILLNSSEKVIAMQASNVVPSYYELYDKTAAYEVNVGSGDLGSSWSITKGTNKATTYVTEFNGADFSNALSVNDKSYDYSHTVVWFAVKYQSGAIDDAVVIDYGLPVDISVLANDMVPSNTAIAGVANTAEGVAAKSLADVTGTYGTLSVVDGAHKLRYTLSTENGMQMSTPEEFYYGVDVDNSLKVGKVTVIPATTVYYEDSFVAFNDSSVATDDYGTWSGTELGIGDVIVQAEDRPGTASIAADANNNYGYDPAYGSYRQFSLGTYQKVTVDMTTGNARVSPSATFTFTGTGFDIISVTDNKSGAIAVSVWRHGDEHIAANKVKGYIVNNYYGYEYNPNAGEGENPWTPTNNSNALYQIPVMKVLDLDYGTYDVEIKVNYLKSMDVTKAEEYSFWLDAIKIYNPAYENEVARKAHEADTEYAPIYAEIRDLLIAGNKLELKNALEEGALFIDGISSVDTAKIQQFVETGPNNEAYIAGGQAVAIQLISNGCPKNVQIGAKLVQGSEASLYLNGKEFVKLNTATDMYYTISGINWNVNKDSQDNEDGTYTSDIIILENHSGDGIISLTNLKVIGAESFAHADANSGQSVTDVVKSAQRTVVAPVSNASTAKRALMMLNSYSAPVVYANPEILDVTLSSNDVTVGESTVITVTTNADAEYINVGDKTVSEYTVAADGSRVWTCTYEAAEAGNVEISVIAVGDDCSTSDIVTRALTVNEEEEENTEPGVWQKVSNFFSNIFDKLFGWIKK